LTVSLALFSVAGGTPLAAVQFRTAGHRRGRGRNIGDGEDLAGSGGGGNFCCDLLLAQLFFILGCHGEHQVSHALAAKVEDLIDQRL
jgi:hypothetical protein